MAANLIDRVPDRRNREARGYNIARARSQARLNNSLRGKEAQELKAEQFRTEQRPGTGGFGSGLETQIRRNQKLSAERRRAESFRPETEIKREIYEGLMY